MTDAKAEFTRDFFNQIESQVQFGDNKASLLVAGDALLLAISGGFAKLAAGGEGELAAAFVRPSITFGLAIISTLLLIVSLACALRAARPAPKILRPVPGADPEFFLLSYVASLTKEEFLERYRSASSDELLSEALIAIHGKAGYAAKKFRWLGNAVDTTLLSLLFLVAAIATRVIFPDLTSIILP